MNGKMMITGEVIKKPEHIELGKYNVTVRTKGRQEACRSDRQRGY